MTDTKLEVDYEGDKPCFHCVVHAAVEMLLREFPYTPKEAINAIIQNLAEVFKISIKPGADPEDAAKSLGRAVTKAALEMLANPDGETLH